jgi:hypothetical protein
LDNRSPVAVDVSGGNSEAGKALHSNGRSRPDFFVAANWVRSNSADARGSLQKILKDVGLSLGLLFRLVAGNLAHLNPSSSVWIMLIFTF